MAHVPLEKLFQFWSSLFVTPQMKRSGIQQGAFNVVFRGVTNKQPLIAVPDVVQGRRVFERSRHHVMSENSDDEVHQLFVPVLHPAVDQTHVKQMEVHDDNFVRVVQESLHLGQNVSNGVVSPQDAVADPEFLLAASHVLKYDAQVQESVSVNELVENILIVADLVTYLRGVPFWAIRLVASSIVSSRYHDFLQSSVADDVSHFLHPARSGSYARFGNESVQVDIANPISKTSVGQFIVVKFYSGKWYSSSVITVGIRSGGSNFQWIAGTFGGIMVK